MTVKDYFDKLSDSWKSAFKGENESEFLAFLDEVENLYSQNPDATPCKENIFRVFELCAFENVKVVFLGQDPYPNKEWACGLAFAFGNNEKPQQSLANIFTELELEGFSPKDSSLTGWVSQGVLMMNTSLTFIKEHSELISKWQKFTSNVLTTLSKNENIAFILLGSAAQKAIKFKNKGNIFKAGHPSNLYQTAKKYFFPQANKELFKKCNEFLKSKGIAEIDWSITK